jgi:hypothetical protein
VFGGNLKRVRATHATGLGGQARRARRRAGSGGHDPVREAHSLTMLILCDRHAFADFGCQRVADRCMFAGDVCVPSPAGRRAGGACQATPSTRGVTRGVRTANLTPGQADGLCPRSRHAADAPRPRAPASARATASRARSGPGTDPALLAGPERCGHIPRPNLTVTRQDSPAAVRQQRGS